MSEKNQSRLRRARSARAKIAELRAVRLTVHRTNGHIYAQIIDPSGAKILASASTAEKDMRAAVPKGGGIPAAAAIGKRIAERARLVGVEKVAFDRSGYKYHGRIKALADAAREAGLKF